MKSTTVPAEVIFIEYRQSNLPHCSSPLNKTNELPQYLLRAPKGLIDAFTQNSAEYNFLYWTEKFIQHHYGKMTIENFKKTTKLSLLKALRKVEGRLVIFTTENILESILPRLRDDLPRVISCATYFAQDIINPNDLICYLVLPPFLEEGGEAGPLNITTSSLLTETAFYS